MATTLAPQFTDTLDLRYFVEPLTAAAHPASYLDRFPRSLYTRAPDSHFMRFMYALLGPVGIGWLKQNIAEARLQLEASGAQLSDLESFYGDPFSFGRILTESFDNDVSGLLSSALWDQIRAQDEAYRSRAIRFLNAARLGGTPQGMQLAASSGTGQNVEIVENYRYLFDSHSDDPLGLPFYGSTLGTGEFIVVPRPAVSQTQVQIVQFALASTPLGTNNPVLSFNGYSTPLLPATVSAPALQTALSALPTIGMGNVLVSGGPAPFDLVVTFTGNLGNQALPAIEVSFTDHTTGFDVSVPVLVTTGSIDPSSELGIISDRERHETQVALDYLRPVGTLPSFSWAGGLIHPTSSTLVSASTAFSQVNRFVTGNPAVTWPPIDSTHWIEIGVENEAPQLQNAASQHYVGFHNVSTVVAYTDTALTDPSYATDSAVLSGYNSTHVGPFPEMSGVMSFFDQFATSYDDVFDASRSLAAYPQQLTVSVRATDGTVFINDIYPADYTTLQGVPALVYHDGDFWSSQARASGAEILEIDLGSPQAVNFITMEVTRKPVSLAIDYDLSDQAPARRFQSVAYISSVPADTELFFDPSQQGAWEPLQFYFNDSRDLIFTRFIRLTFTRRVDSPTSGRFLFDPTTQTQTPWSVEVRNLRIGRNIAPTVA